MKIVFLAIVMAIVLLTSSCATLFSLLDTTAAKTYNDSLATLSEDDREIADKIGLTDVKPSINIAVAVAVDAWALSPIILSSFYADQQEPPPFASIIATTGIFGGIPASLICSAISFGSTFRTPPSTQIQRYHAQVAQAEREAEARRIMEEMEAKVREDAKKAREEFLKNPSSCPLVIEKIEIIPNSYSYNIKLTIKNISPWAVSAFKVRISGWSVFNDRLTLAVGSDDLVGLAHEIYLGSQVSNTFTWGTYADGLSRVEAEIIQVLHEGGRQWPQ
ncbi:MAG: hypothetical protein QM445_04915 [Thermotogota bacterium]|nr:hypothetical protein [Thermotogota bacterium]